MWKLLVPDVAVWLLELLRVCRLPCVLNRWPCHQKCFVGLGVQWLFQGHWITTFTVLLWSACVSMVAQQHLGLMSIGAPAILPILELPYPLALDGLCTTNMLHNAQING